MNRKFSLPLLTALLLIGGATLTAKFIRASFSANGVANHVGESNIEPVKTAQASDEAPSNIQVALWTIRSDGFEPAEIDLSAGDYLLVIRNRTGLDEIEVRLVRENGEELGPSKITARRKDWKERVKLKTGTYLFRETTHPDWISRVVVREK